MNEQSTPWFGRVLWALIRRQPMRYGLALVLWTAIWTMPVLVGLITARFFDTLAEGIEVSQVMWLVAATFAYAAARSVFVLFGMRNHGSMLHKIAREMVAEMPLPTISTLKSNGSTTCSTSSRKRLTTSPGVSSRAAAPGSS